MALATTNETRPAPVMHPTPGVGMQGPAPTTTDQPPAKPTLPPDIDPVLLVRLYPGATDAADMRAQAMAAGEATAAAGAELQASQNEPVAIEGDGTTPAPAPAPRPTQQPAPHQPAAHEPDHKRDDKK